MKTAIRLLSVALTLVVVVGGYLILRSDTPPESVVLSGVARSAAPAVATTTTTTAPSTTVVESVDPVIATTPPTRVRNAHQTGDTLPLPDPKIIVNSLPYEQYNPEPAKQAWYLMTSLRGCPNTEYIACWDKATQDAWWPFVYDVMKGESAFCPNRLRGDTMIPYSMCVHEVDKNGRPKQGPHEDAGFGQATSAWHGRNGLTCKLVGLCGKHAIIESPWNSMLGSVIVPMEQAGSQPWCWDARARRIHPTCYDAPDGRY